MATKTITINANGAASPPNPTLHRSASNGDNAVKWQAGGGPWTVSGLPTGVFDPEPPSSGFQVSSGNPSAEYTVVGGNGSYSYTITGDDFVQNGQPGITIDP